jgi:hypothetical protein
MTSDITPEQIASFAAIQGVTVDEFLARMAGIAASPDPDAACAAIDAEYAARGWVSDPDDEDEDWVEAGAVLAAVQAHLSKPADPEHLSTTHDIRTLWTDVPLDQACQVMDLWHSAAHAGQLAAARAALIATEAPADREARLHQILKAALPGLAHVCRTGPVCAPWYEDYPPARHGGPESDGCGAGSCWEIMFGQCLACQVEDSAEEAAEAEASRPAREMLASGYCPALVTNVITGPNTCGSPLAFEATYGAPGTGQAWRCTSGHPWTKVAGQFWPPEAGAHILTLADVI